MTRLTLSAALLTVLFGVLIAAAPASSPNFPARIDLPPPVPPNTVNFAPEGIATGRGHTFYMGSTATGEVLVGDYRTGEVPTTLVPASPAAPDPGHRSIYGVFVDNKNRLWAAGGATGKAYVFDASTGVELAEYQLELPTPGIINDVVVTNTAAYFTKTSPATATTFPLFKVPLGAGGALPDPTAPSSVQTLTLTPGFPGSNGIDVLPDGNLIVVSITNGNLYKVDPNTGAATQIVVDGTLLSGDGLILDGNTLYYVENRAANNAVQPGDIVVVRLSTPDYATGHIVMHINSPTDPLSGPATADQFGHLIYVVRRNVPTVPVTPRLNWLTQIVKPTGSD